MLLVGGDGVGPAVEDLAGLRLRERRAVAAVRGAALAHQLVGTAAERSLAPCVKRVVAVAHKLAVAGTARPGRRRPECPSAVRLAVANPLVVGLATAAVVAAVGAGAIALRCPANLAAEPADILLPVRSQSTLLSDLARFRHRA